MGHEEEAADAVEFARMEADAALFPLLARLDSWGEANPDRYGGSWINEESTVGVAVVGAVVAESLRELVAGEPVDVVVVKHPLHRLEELAERIVADEQRAGQSRVTAVDVCAPDNVVDVRSAVADLAGLQKWLRDVHHSDAIRVGRERRARLMGSARTRQRHSG